MKFNAASAALSAAMLSGVMAHEEVEESTASAPELPNFTVCLHTAPLNSTPAAILQLPFPSLPPSCCVAIDR